MAFSLLCFLSEFSKKTFLGEDKEPLNSLFCSFPGKDKLILNRNMKVLVRNLFARKKTYCSIF